MNVKLSRSSDTSLACIREAFRPEDYSFSVDWLNVRLDCDNLSLVLLAIQGAFPEIDLSFWLKRDSGGVCFYKEGIYLSTLGYSSFVISFNKDENGHIVNHGEKMGDLYGIQISISGDGCRYISSLHKNGFAHLLQALKPFNPHCSRIDIACDIFDKDNMIVPMIQTFADFAYDRENALYDLNCNLKRGKDFCTFYSVYDDSIKNYTRNITIGGRSCKKGTLQLYNKRVEIESNRLVEHSEAILNAFGNPEYWWRLEYRCKSYAHKVFMNLMESQSIFSAFLEAANGFGMFVVSTGDVRTIHRCEYAVEWVSFLAFVEKLMSGKVFILYNSGDFVNMPYIPSEISKVRNFHTNQINSSDAKHWVVMLLDKVHRRVTIDGWVQDLLLNPKNNAFKSECCKEYGLKLEEMNDLIWQQSSFFTV